MTSEIVARLEAAVDPSYPSFLVGDKAPEDRKELDALMKQARASREVFAWLPGYRLLLVRTTENPRVWLTVEFWDGPPEDAGDDEWQVESWASWEQLDALSVWETGTGRWPLEEIMFRWLPEGPYTVHCRGRGRAETPLEVTDDGQDRYLMQIWPASPE
jgi:hypothetical protein